jgi:hypothetical protein
LKLCANGEVEITQSEDGDQDDDENGGTILVKSTQKFEKLTRLKIDLKLSPNAALSAGLSPDL